MGTFCGEKRDGDVKISKYDHYAVVTSLTPTLIPSGLHLTLRGGGACEAADISFWPPNRPVFGPIYLFWGVSY